MRQRSVFELKIHRESEIDNQKDQHELHSVVTGSNNYQGTQDYIPSGGEDSLGAAGVSENIVRMKINLKLYLCNFTKNR